MHRGNTEHIALSAAAAAGIPRTMLDDLAAHARACGECLIMLDRKGAVMYHDARCAAFFQRYLVPLLGAPALTGADLGAASAAVAVSSPPTILNDIPGAAMCLLPWVQRRQLHGIMLLAATRLLTDDDHGRAAELCRRLGLEPASVLHGDAFPPPRTRADLVADALRLRKLAESFARMSAMDEEIQSLSAQLANAYEELALIEQISGGMRVNRDIADFFHQTCLDVMQVLAVRGMGVAFYHEQCPAAPIFHGEIDLDFAKLAHLSQTVLASLCQRRGWLLVNDVGASAEYGWLSGTASRLLAVPLQRGEHLLGCFFALDKIGGEFDSVDAKLLTSIAGESAVYLENALLFGDLHDLLMGLLRSLTSAVDAKDAYTCGHSERVALLSRHLATNIGLPPNEVERIYMAGLLHDVGKIGVPESVLQKTGKLTPEEFELMKKHCQIGASILADVRQLSDVVPAVLHHHERYDGRGYPAQLAGRDIPLAGRIICLADAFDAMTSNRTYRKALPLEVALTEIRRCSGTQFDPALAEVFLQIPQETFRTLLQDHDKQARALLELQQSLRAA